MTEKPDNEKFCIIPFIQLQLNPLGNVSACCFASEHSVGNVQNAKIEDLWNSEEMQRWRTEFLTGDIKICEQAMKTFHCHKMYRHLHGAAPLEAIQKQPPRRLDLRLNGMCNLRCVMCDVWDQPDGLYDKSDFWTWGQAKMFASLVEMDVLGGEPFIQKDTFRLIKEVSAVNPNCSWGFITNASYKFTPKLEQHLDMIKIRHVHISIDSLKPLTYSKIRVNGRLPQTLKTIDSFLKYREKRWQQGRPFAILASMCIQKHNWMELPKFLKFCEERGFGPILQNVIVDNNPKRSALSVKKLPPASQKKLITLYRKVASETQNTGVKLTIQEILRSLGAFKD